MLLSPASESLPVLRPRERLTSSGTASAICNERERERQSRSRQQSLTQSMSQRVENEREREKTHLGTDADEPRPLAPPPRDPVLVELALSRLGLPRAEVGRPCPHLDREVVSAVVDRLGRRVEAEGARAVPGARRGRQRELGLEVERERHGRVPAAREEGESQLVCGGKAVEDRASSRGSRAKAVGQHLGPVLGDVGEEGHERCKGRYRVSLCAR